MTVATAVTQRPARLDEPEPAEVQEMPTQRHQLIIAYLLRRLEDGGYAVHGTVGVDEMVTSALLAGFSVDVAEMFGGAVGA